MYKFVIIGCGTAGSLHAAQTATLGKLEAVCDIKPEKAQALGEKHDARAYRSIEDLLSGTPDADIVCVCTPAGLHAEHIIKSLQAGRNVISESPLCLTKAAAWQMIETEKFCGRRLVPYEAYHSYRLPAGLETKITAAHSFELICHDRADEQEDGNSWQLQRFPGGGRLYTSFCREIDLLVKLFGLPAIVKGSTGGQISPSATENNGEAEMQMANGSKGRLAWATGGAERKSQLRIFDEKGGITSIDLPGNRLQHGDIYPGMLRDFHEKKSTAPLLLRAAATAEAIEKIYKGILPENHD
ncbi:MAG TPA: Gfo/Idh/MocA family oxidoreductase [Flavisolibacter sp.]|nr:Gfo/Idh/MocA family oxidoreductase [Flavisolibacter sp.]